MNRQLGAGDVAVISGGGRGVGRAIAVELAERGVACILLDAPDPAPHTASPPALDADALAATTAEIAAINEATVGCPVDVRDRQAVGAALATAAATVGDPTLLVVAAAVFNTVEVGRMNDDEWDEVLDTNLHGAYNVAREVLPGMVARGRGRVLFLVGDEGRRGVAGLSHLAAASWGAIGLAKSIALETAAAGVGVNVLCTGPVRGEVTDGAAFRRVAGDESVLATKHPNNEAWVPTGDVVDAALFLLGRPGTSMSGSVLDVSNGMSALNTA